MGGSRRRLKKTQPKIKVGTAITKKKKTNKSSVPLELREQSTDLQKKLDIDTQWEKEKNLSSNYRANHLLLDANQGFGRNSSAPRLKGREEREEAGEKHFDDDDELLAGCNLQRSSGPAVPPRLTPKQRSVLTALVSAHGDNLDAMVLDTKRNVLQHSAGQLRKLLVSMQYWSGSTAERHDFRAPKKRPKKIF